MKRGALDTRNEGFRIILFSLRSRVLRGGWQPVFVVPRSLTNIGHRDPY